MSDALIQLDDVSKFYRLFRRPVDKVLDALGVARWLFWREKRYEEFPALQKIDLAVPRGQRLGIIGSNGAGKSTLLKLIAGIMPPTSGAIAVNGRVQALMELGTGFHPELTGRQNIRAALSYQGFSSRDIRDKEEEIIDFAELSQFIDLPIKTYSAGMNARLAFSTATSVEPDILIVDEILGAGDASFQNKCIARMTKYTAAGRATMLFVSHDLSGVQAMCEKTIWIDHGRIVAEGDTLDVLRKYYRAVIEEEKRRLAAPGDAATPQGVSAHRHSVVTWKTPDPRIVQVRFLDGAGQPVASILEGEDLTVEIEYYCSYRCQKPAFEASFYTINGTVIVLATNVIVAQPIDIEGQGKVRFHFRPFNVGAGDYVMTCSIFEFLDPRRNVMPPMYDQHDRSYHLRIHKLPGLELGLGIVRMPYTVEYVAEGGLIVPQPACAAPESHGETAEPSQAD